MQSKRAGDPLERIACHITRPGKAKQQKPPSRKGIAMNNDTAPSVNDIPARDDYQAPANAIAYAAAIVPGPTYDPFAHIEALGYELRRMDLPLGILGLTDFTNRTVTLDSHLYSHEARATAAHEVVHIERGPLTVAAANASRSLALADGRNVATLASEEEACDALAAARLLPFDHLMAAARGADSIEELAESAGADRALLFCRLAQLSRWQHDQVLRAAQHAEHGSRLQRRTPMRRRPPSKIRQPLPWQGSRPGGYGRRTPR